MPDPVVIGGRHLRIGSIEAVARGRPEVTLSDEARTLVAASRATVERLVAAGSPVYGVTTGFGDLADRSVATDDVRRLQRNLLLSHAAGVGSPLEVETVRAMLLLRAHTLALGFSGCRPILIERLLDLLRLELHPRVPEQGSVGASGDLAPLAHLALPLIGRGEVGDPAGGWQPAESALAAAGLEPLVLEAKEGLALLNGTQLMTALGVLLLVDAERLARTASVIGAMSLEALLGTDVAFAAAYHAARPHPGQALVAAEMRHLLRDSALQRAHKGVPHKVQDPYSLRCIPQVHGASRDALGYLRGVLEIEVNSATDNPLVFPEGDATNPDAVATGGGFVVSGGNFHGQPVALALDFAGIAIAELGSISERRTALLMDGRLSGLPAFLVPNPGLDSGLMMLQYTAAALVSEDKGLAHPASVDTIPTSANQEDHVSMGPIAGRQARAILRNVEQVLAIELLCAAQALDLRMRASLAAPGEGVRAAHERVRAVIDHVDADREPGPDLAAALALVRDGALLDLVDDVPPV